MRKRLQLLQDLQVFDLKIDGRNAERQALVAELEGFDRRIAEAKEAVEAKLADSETLSTEKQSVEQNLELENENIQRSEVRLSEIKTQKEYQAVLKEIASAKKVKGELEEQVLQKTARLEELAAEIEAGQADLASLEGNLETQKAEVQEKLKVLDAEIAAERTERDETEKALPATLVNRYNTLRQRRQGVAVVEARDGSCLGCNMNIPPQLYNTLHKCDDILFCPHCQRVLFIRQNDEAAA